MHQEGLEPSLLKESDFESDASAYSTTGASYLFNVYQVPMI